MGRPKKTENQSPEKTDDSQETDESQVTDQVGTSKQVQNQNEQQLSTNNNMISNNSKKIQPIQQKSSDVILVNSNQMQLTTGGYNEEFKKYIDIGDDSKPSFDDKTDEEVQIIHQIVQSGIPYKEISEKYNVSEYSLRQSYQGNRGIKQIRKDKLSQINRQKNEEKKRKQLSRIFKDTELEAQVFRWKLSVDKQVQKRQDNNKSHTNDVPQYTSQGTSSSP